MNKTKPLILHSQFGWAVLQEAERSLKVWKAVTLK